MTPPPTSASLPTGTHVGQVALRVTTPAELTAFYRDVVGLRVHDRTETTTVLGIGDAPLLVLEHDDAPPRSREETGLYHTAFRVPTRAALGDALRRGEARWQLDGASDHGVSEALYLTDPEGNGVEIYCDAPRETWAETEDGRVRMPTAPLDRSSVEAEATGADHLPTGSDIGHVHLEVSSLTAVREFYVEALGFAVRADAPGALFLAAGDYHHHVGANTWHSRTDPPAGRGLSWFEVLVPDGEALEGVRDRLADRSIPATTGEDGAETLTVSDPDGLEIRFRVTPS